MEAYITSLSLTVVFLRGYLYLISLTTDRCTFLHCCQDDYSLYLILPIVPVKIFPWTLMLLCQISGANGPPIPKIPNIFTFQCVFPCQQTLCLIQHLPWLNSLLLESWNYHFYSLKTTFMLSINVDTVLHILKGRVWQRWFSWLCKPGSEQRWGDCPALSPKSMPCSWFGEFHGIFTSCFTDESYFSLKIGYHISDSSPPK